MRTACAIWRRRGAVRRPARSSTSERTGSSPAALRAAARSTASATTARSRCTWRAAPTTCSPSTCRRRRSFALHLARGADHVVALDSSAHALTRAAENFRRNGLANGEFVEANAFEFLKDRERERARFDTIVLDPPAFAKTRSALAAAIRGYKEINLRAMRILAPGGMLFTASCSYHLTKPLFLEMLEQAAADSGRRLVLRELRGQPFDHPEVLTIPETGYIKGALLEALD